MTHHSRHPFTPLKNGVHYPKLALGWMNCFGLMLLASCTPISEETDYKEFATHSEHQAEEVTGPTVNLEKPASGMVQCYSDNDDVNSPSLAFSFDEENSSAKFLMDEKQEFNAEYNTASIILNYSRKNVIETDSCKWTFNRISGDGTLHCMLAETDNFQQEMNFKCQPLGKRKF